MASASVGSCFSTTITSRALPPKLPSSDAVLLRLPLPLRACRPQHLLSVAHLYNPQSFRFPRRTLAAVAQDEATAAAVQEEEEEEEAAAEETGEAEAQPLEEAASLSPADTAAVAQTTKLYFGNMPYNCDSAQLAGIIQEYASPELVEVLYDRDTGRSRGFAFVTMSSVEDCEQVINNLDGTQFGGRTMKVNFADKPKPKEPLYPETEHKLFVGNLSWSVTSEVLTEVFQEHGNVVGARVLYDGDTSRSRGYGFVCYSTKEEMEHALEVLNGMELDGRALRVSLALGKKS
ncbi:31 kDa ribonucleoprotein, chloroplastic-like [Zingiber officinale]|uniref:31 kDa ribonucleoprotein, chloroplastic-like n=1 Tax=Zingiber officinale TaxID=94328 RepID=UPI001C4D1004|nr:31 kDa ribonucleoprotein, chloroplastic-like [Zingiber officinale]